MAMWIDRLRADHFVRSMVRELGTRGSPEIAAAILLKQHVGHQHVGSMALNCSAGGVERKLVQRSIMIRSSAGRTGLLR